MDIHLHWSVKGYKKVSHSHILVLVIVRTFIWHNSSTLILSYIDIDLINTMSAPKPNPNLNFCNEKEDVGSLY